MSLLYEALNKAAHEYKRENSPVFIPLLPVRHSKHKTHFYGVCATLLVVSVVCAFYFAVLKAEPVSPPPPVLAAAVTPVSAASFSQSQPSATPSNARKLQQAETAGIALPVDALATEVQAPVREIAELTDQIEDSGAVKERPDRALSAAAAMVRMEGADGESASSLSRTLGKAQALVGAKKWEAALSLYDRVLVKEKTNKRAIAGKSYALEQRGGDEDAQKLEEMTALYPDNPLVYAAQARLLVRQKDAPAALVAWEKAVELDPANKDYRLGLAILHDNLGHEAQALRLYREVPAPLPREALRRIDYLAGRQSSAQVSVSDANEDQEE